MKKTRNNAAPEKDATLVIQGSADAQGVQGSVEVQGSVWQRVMDAFREDTGLTLSAGDVLLLSEVPHIRYWAEWGDRMDKMREEKNSPPNESLAG